MSGENEADEMICASCGVAEIDDVKLKECDGCDLVRYCGDECQKNHRKKHKRKCKKRAAELRDEILFKQPEGTCYGDCPICMVPLGSLELTKFSVMGCCSKFICKGCFYAKEKSELEARLLPACPFCREPMPDTEEEIYKRRTKRLEANDPVAICYEGERRYKKGEYSSAFEYYTKSAELGDPRAHCRLADLYHEGLGVEKDRKKEIHHYEEAAIGGHPGARCNLGAHEAINENNERSVKHYVIAATQGDDNSIKALMEGFQDGLVKKEDLDTALRAHYAAVNATKSPQRDAAEKWEAVWGNVGSYHIWLNDRSHWYDCEEEGCE